MTLGAGASVGAYEIAGLVGEGGMGQVYRAHDPRLGRDVAIKVLPPAFSTDADRLRRFEQEARAAAALNHPNILAVYDVGTHDGAPYIVSELLTGTSLRDRIGTGPLPIRRAIETGVQIARGLAAAHEKGIVHRDLKPENLFVTEAGAVKILDFGLAKLTETTPAAADSLSTRQADTGSGVVMGTVGYMAPEQIRGLGADHRADIFAFGAVLYKLLAGERAFRGPTSADVTTAILKEDPPDLPAAERHIPLALTRIVDRCLEKAPSARFQSAGDLAFALESLSTHTSAIEPAAATSRQPRGRLAWSLAAALGAALLSVVGYGAWRLARTPDAEIVSTAFPLTMPEGWSLTLRAIAGSSLAPLAVSPDGRHIAFVASAADGRRSL